MSSPTYYIGDMLNFVPLTAIYAIRPNRSLRFGKNGTQAGVKVRF